MTFWQTFSMLMTLFIGVFIFVAWACIDKMDHQLYDDEDQEDDREW